MKFILEKSIIVFSFVVSNELLLTLLLIATVAVTIITGNELSQVC